MDRIQCTGSSALAPCPGRNPACCSFDPPITAVWEPDCSADAPETPLGRSAAAPGTLRGLVFGCFHWTQILRIDRTYAKYRPKTELSFESGVHFELRSPSARSSSAHHSYLLGFMVLWLYVIWFFKPMSRHRPPTTDCNTDRRHQHRRPTKVFGSRV